MAENPLYQPFKQIIGFANLLHIVYIVAFCHFCWFHDINSDYSLRTISAEESTSPRWFYWTFLKIGELQSEKIPYICEIVYNTMLTLEMLVVHSVLCALNASKYTLASEKYLGPFWYGQTFGLVSTLMIKNILTGWIPINDVLFDFSECQCLTIGLQIIGGLGLLLMLHSDMYLLDFITKNPGKVCDQGFYKHIRHPIYTGLILFYSCRSIVTIGTALFSGLFIGYILITVYFHEEPRVVKQMGIEYVKYMESTPRFVPSLKFGGSKDKKE